MSTHAEWNTGPSDRELLRALARRVRDISADPVMAERRQLWLRHASLDGERPMILAETQGVLDEVVPQSVLECEEDWARDLERRLRALIFQYEVVRDDYVVEPWINCNWVVSLGDFGVSIGQTHGDNADRLGSYVWDPPVKDLDRDLEKLRHRAPSVDREGTLAWKTHLEDVFDGILPIRIRGSFYWTTGLTWRAIDLIGLGNLMLAMHDNPAGLHRLMAFLRDDHHALIDWRGGGAVLAEQRERLRGLGDGGLHDGAAPGGPQPRRSRARGRPVGALRVAGDGGRIPADVRGVHLSVPAPSDRAFRPVLLRVL